jgi:type II secretory pathway pseudopilin PulG
MTLFEVLVVFAVIAGMLCLLVPVVSAGREAARRAQCQANLHQIGIAMTHYTAARRKLPPAAVAGTMSGWAIEILPFIEETVLADGLAGSALNSPAALALAQKRPRSCAVRAVTMATASWWVYRPAITPVSSAEATNGLIG